MILKKIMIKKFISQLPNCSEFRKGEIVLNYKEQKILSFGNYINTANVEMNLTDAREMDEQSKAFFEGLIRKGKEWEEIHFIRIVLLPKDIEIYIMGIKNGVQLGEKAPI